MIDAVCVVVHVLVSFVRGSGVYYVLRCLLEHFLVYLFCLNIQEKAQSGEQKTYFHLSLLTFLGLVLCNVNKR